MVHLTVSSRGLVKKLTAISKDAPKIINGALADNAIETAIDARTVHRFTPRTGTLQRATWWRLDKRLNRRGVYQVIYYIKASTASYGRWIHDGTRRWAPDKYLLEAVQRSIYKAQRSLWATYKRLIKSKGM